MYKLGAVIHFFSQLLPTRGLPTSDPATTAEEHIEHQAQISGTSSLVFPQNSPPDTLGTFPGVPTHSPNWDFDPRAKSGNQGTNAAHLMIRDDVLRTLSTMWRDKESREDICNLKGYQAQLIINYLYSVLSMPALLDPWLRSHCTVTLYKLSAASQLYPYCHKLKKSIVLGPRQPSFDALSDICKGRFGEKHLCFKVIYAKEAILWGELHHPNVTPFYGIYRIDQELEQICLVSPWMQHGNIIEYLKRRPSAPRALFVFDTVSGLSYLHELGLIHGDLKGANILVNDMEQACITDFGLSFIRTDKSLSRVMETSIGHDFIQRWIAPELLDDPHPTMASDIWALGCICLEILTGKPPYHGLSDSQVIRMLTQGKAPTRSTTLTNHADTAVWKEVDSCWMVNPEDRPKCQEILLRLRRAGISRGESDLAQHDTEEEIQQFRDALRAEHEEPVDIQAVTKLLKSLQKRK